MSDTCVEVERSGDFATIWMNRPERRNALSREHLGALTDAFVAVGAGPVRGVILAGRGPVFCAGHDFADLAGASLESVRALLDAGRTLCETMQSIPQPVVARVHGLATAAGCQLVATADLAVAADTAGFAVPGGKGGWFCHTPMVAVGRTLGPKRAVEMAFTGDVIDAATALAWGLVNAVVAPDELDGATEALLVRATRGSSASKALGKATLYAQLGLGQRDAYDLATPVMAESSQSADAQEAMAAFLEKRGPEFGSPPPGPARR